MRGRQQQQLLEGKYRLLGTQLGEGGLGRVFLAEDIRNGEKVAIKQTIKSLQQSTLVKELAENQVETLGKLQGKRHILQMREYFERDERLFIVTELCSGGSLSSLIKKRLLTLPTAIEILGCILRGYLQIAQAKIIHRDIKPTNLLLTGAGELRIADFGFATTLDNLSQEGPLSIGSTLYMSPEALSSYKYSNKSDIWAIGVTFFEMLTGAVPWREKNKKKMFAKIMARPVLTLLPKGLDVWIYEFLHRALDPNETSRASIQELLSLLPGEETDYSVFSHKESETEVTNDSDHNILNISECITSHAPSESYLSKGPLTSSSRSIVALTARMTDRITSALMSQIDFFRLEHELVRLVGCMKSEIPSFATFVNSCGIEEFIWSKIQQRWNRIEEVNHTGLQEIQADEAAAYKSTGDHATILRVVQQYRVKYAPEMKKLPAKKLLEGQESECLGQILLWLSQEVRESSSYQLFVLLDYLVTLKWLYCLEATQQLEQLADIELGDLVVALRKQSRATHKSIRPEHLKQLPEKLRSLGISAKK